APPTHARSTPPRRAQLKVKERSAFRRSLFLVWSPALAWSRLWPGGWRDGGAASRRGRVASQLQCEAVGAARPLSCHAANGLALPDSIPVCTSLFGDTSDTTSTGLAQRLARKTSKQVFVSYNLSNTDSNFTLLVENRIKEEMETFPEKF
uniref:Proteasome assembly chaperone 4 n=1 Tax=Rattus norvegicus TaxID=10116 RepID=F7F2U9_RAT